MAFSNQQLYRLLQLVATTREKAIDCDECLQHIAEFAEIHLQGLTPCEQLAEVKLHLQSCPCCEDEFQAFMEAIQALKDGGID